MDSDIQHLHQRGTTLNDCIEVSLLVERGETALLWCLAWSIGEGPVKKRLLRLTLDNHGQLAVAVEDMEYNAREAVVDALSIRQPASLRSAGASKAVVLVKEYPLARLPGERLARLLQIAEEIFRENASRYRLEDGQEQWIIDVLVEAGNEDIVPRREKDACLQDIYRDILRPTDPVRSALLLPVADLSILSADRSFGVP